MKNDLYFQLDERMGSGQNVILRFSQVTNSILHG